MLVLIWGLSKANYFYGWDWTTQISLKCFDKIAVLAHPIFEAQTGMKGRTMRGRRASRCDHNDRASGLRAHSGDLRIQAPRAALSKSLSGRASRQFPQA
jgi:hypothetical protein